MKEEYLKKLGLTSYEIKVFLILSQLRESKAREISEISKVPYGRIYDVLYSLEQKGLVSVILSTPKIFKANKFDIAIEKLIEKQKSEIKEIETEKERILKEFETSKSVLPAVEEKEKISVYYGSTVAIEIGRIGIEKANKEILINTTRLEDPLAQKLIANKILQGISVRIMIPKITKENYKNIKKIQNLGGKIKVGGINGMKIGIADTKGTLITVTNPKNLKGSITIVVEGKNFAKSMKKFFNIYWNRAKEVI